LIEMVNRIYTSTLDEETLKRFYDRVVHAYNKAKASSGSRRGTVCKIINVDPQKWIQYMKDAPMPTEGVEYDSITSCSLGLGLSAGTLSVMRSRHKLTKEIVIRGVTIQLI